MRLGTLTEEFYNEYSQCFENPEVEVVGELRERKQKSTYLIRKHLSTTTGGASPCYDRLGRGYEWISYDGKSLREHQEERRFTAYLWIEIEYIVLHPQSNRFSKHVLERVED